MVRSNSLAQLVQLPPPRAELAPPRKGLSLPLLQKVAHQSIDTPEGGVQVVIYVSMWVLFILGWGRQRPDVAAELSGSFGEVFVNCFGAFG